MRTNLAIPYLTRRGHSVRDANPDGRCLKRVAGLKPGWLSRNILIFYILNRFKGSPDGVAYFFISGICRDIAL